VCNGRSGATFDRGINGSGGNCAFLVDVEPERQGVRIVEDDGFTLMRVARAWGDGRRGRNLQLPPLWVVGRPAARRQRAERRDDLQVVLGHERADLELTGDNHRERRRLDPSDREVVVVKQAVGSRKVHPDQPIGAASGASRVRQPVERLAIRERTEATRSPRA
jgi:hypothetical protein